MSTPPAAGSPGLVRALGAWMATAVVVGTVIGSGVFKKPHAVSLQLSEFGLIMLAWTLVGVLSFIGSLILAEVAIIHPRAGGNYVKYDGVVNNDASLIFLNCIKGEVNTWIGLQVEAD